MWRCLELQLQVHAVHCGSRRMTSSLGSNIQDCVWFIRSCWSFTGLRNVCISRFIGLMKEFCYFYQSGLRFSLIICCSRCFGSSIWAGWRCGTQIWCLGRAVRRSATVSSSCSSAARRTAAGRGWDGFLSELIHLISVINSHVSLVLTLRDRWCCWSCRTSLSPSLTPLTTPFCTLSQSAASMCGEWGGASAG